MTFWEKYNEYLNENEVPKNLWNDYINESKDVIEVDIYETVGEHSSYEVRSEKDAEKSIQEYMDSDDFDEKNTQYIGYVVYGEPERGKVYHATKDYIKNLKKNAFASDGSYDTFMEALKKVEKTGKPQSYEY